MDLAAFFADDVGDVDQVVFRSDDLLEIGRGKVSYRQVGRQLEGRAMQLLHERYGPGAATGKMSLRHSGEEGGIVISGQLELTLDGERHLLGPGDAYYFKSSHPHRFRNIGTEECVVVSACSPPSV
jgi:mannose-6-phosphate isomerase-like protein (cupin superfamily)